MTGTVPPLLCRGAKGTLSVDPIVETQLTTFLGRLYPAMSPQRGGADSLGARRGGNMCRPAMHALKNTLARCQSGRNTRGTTLHEIFRHRGPGESVQRPS